MHKKPLPKILVQDNIGTSTLAKKAFEELFITHLNPMSK